MIKTGDKICLTLKNIEALRAIGFTSTEILTVGVCLTLTDSCWCGTVPNNVIITFLGLTERGFYYALEKIKKFGVVKINGRYDYSKFVDFLETATEQLDKPE